MAKIAAGATLPDVKVKVGDEVKSIKDVFTDKGVLFAVPGAFTPTCSEKHLPGFVSKASELAAKGVKTIACIAVNDPFVMKAWKKDVNVPDSVLMISDGNGDFTKAIGMVLDASANYLGSRSNRYAMIIEPGAKVAWVGEGEDSFVDVVLSKL
ncbi:unnamed protein product [Vitrella brassicaformis CCMP3155]|uniref:Thioredoxin domain-containing protein n=2 Tax=Vitrella brassicaformis TaxID=1169539 RepID=A0A0G4GP43_VITBC|nr:unnamed protein product [Vitrella brassicaformis CCMP3155]|eukprot:CEM31945.1 unnamed protein product [Vitrella brassicaformis CCMP3155]